MINAGTYAERLARIDPTFGNHYTGPALTGLNFRLGPGDPAKAAIFKAKVAAGRARNFANRTDQADVATVNMVLNGLSGDYLVEANRGNPAGFSATGVAVYQNALGKVSSDWNALRKQFRNTPIYYNPIWNTLTAYNKLIRVGKGKSITDQGRYNRAIQSKIKTFARNVSAYRQNNVGFVARFDAASNRYNNRVNAKLNAIVDTANYFGAASPNRSQMNRAGGIEVKYNLV